jgi:hypothetical protein
MLPRVPVIRDGPYPIPGGPEDVLVHDHQAGVEQGGEIRDELIRAGELMVQACRADPAVVTRNSHTYSSVEPRS